MAKFAVGQQVQAQTYARVRVTAGYMGKSDNTDLITVLTPGDEVTIVGDSVQQDGLTWWKVKPNGNEAGWTAESAPDGTVLLAEYDDSTWGRSIAFVLQAEGGLSTDPHDPGGITKYGISKRAYPDLDIANLTIEQAKTIYYRDYWQASKSDCLPWPLCLAHFDFSVNAGVGQANKTLSQCNYNFEQYNELRRAFYRSLPQFPRYGKAWLRRVNDLVKYVQ